MAKGELIGSCIEPPDRERRAISISLLAVLGVVLAYFGLLLALNTSSPFTTIVGRSMEPTYSPGDFILMRGVSPSEVKVGDIISVKPNAAQRQKYGVPDSITHRVTSIEYTPNGPLFHTKGDNAAPDGFVVSGSEINGTPAFTIPYAGYILLYLRSTQGLIFLIALLVLGTIYSYSSKLEKEGRRLTDFFRRKPCEPAPENTVVLQKTEELSASVQLALDRFASAMAEYATHLKSHTGAVVNLDEASQGLKQSVTEQERVLAKLAEVLETMARKDVDCSNPPSHN